MKLRTAVPAVAAMSFMRPTALPESIEVTIGRNRALPAVSVRRVADPLVIAGDGDVDEKHRFVDHLEIQRSVIKPCGDVERRRAFDDVLFAMRLVFAQRHLDFGVEYPLVVGVGGKEMQILRKLMLVRLRYHFEGVGDQNAVDGKMAAAEILQMARR